MALTNFAASDSTMRRKEWALEAWKAGRDSSFFFQSGFMGSGTDDTTKPVHYVKDLTKTRRGDQCVMHLIPDVTGDGVPGDQRLKGTEEQLQVSDITITLDQYRKALRNEGMMAEQKTVIRFTVQAKDQLGNWLGQAMDELAFLTTSGVSYGLKLDGTTRAASSRLSQLAFAADVTAPSTNRVFYAGVATSTATLTATDRMSWQLIVGVQAYAQRKRIKPMRHNGRDCYAIVMSVEQARDLKKDPDYMTNVGRAANSGNKNPLFTGAFADIDGVYLFAHPKVNSTLGLSSGSRYGATGTVHGAQALLLGAQALGFARIGDPRWTKDADDDYENQDNMALVTQIGYKKPKFTSIYDGGANEDFSVVSVYTAAGATS